LSWKLRAQRASLSLVLLLLLARPASAQSQGPIYIVVTGDNLTAIAGRFGVRLDALMAANSFDLSHVLQPGDRLTIPGFEGVSGVLTTHVVEFGENLTTLSFRYGLPSATLLRLNRITNGERLFVGEELVVVEPEAGSETAPGASRVAKGYLAPLAPNELLLLAAARTGANPWAVVQLNGLASFADQFSGRTLVVAGGDRALRAWPAPLEEVAFRTFPLVQGRTAVISATAPADLAIDGQLAGHTVNFAAYEGHWVALQGVSAMLEPGVYPFSMRLRLADGTTREFAQDVGVASGDYPNDPPLAVNPETIDPQVNQAELDAMRAIVSTFTPERAWTTVFSPPVDTGITSFFGRRRLFNGIFATYHAGIDFAGRVGREIYSPAGGRVVFTATQEVCGLATVIDHGWGVYSRFCHQDSVNVSSGEVIPAGALIGAIGRSGRVTGPHLHWEVWVGGVQVDPQQWLEEMFP
jgi:murein DD-endopeptidase MepM/ murein hydrolase activator NlpD